MGNVGDLSYTIMRLASQAITVTRGTAGSNDGSGHYVPGGTSAIPMTANVQPAQGNDLLRLEEGFRTREAIALFTRDQLLTASAATGVPSDIVTANGGTLYQVQHSEPWPHGNLYRSIAVKVGA